MMGFGMAGGMWLWIILIIVFVVVVAVLAGKYTAGPGSADTGKHDNAEDILRKRYARGELTREEYERM